MKDIKQILDEALEEFAYYRVFQIYSGSERKQMGKILSAEEIRSQGERITTSKEIKEKYREKFKFYFFLKRAAEKIKEEHEQEIDLYNFLIKEGTIQTFMKASLYTPIFFGHLLGIQLGELYPRFMARAMARCNAAGVDPETYMLRMERTKFEFNITVNEYYDFISSFF